MHLIFITRNSTPLKGHISPPRGHCPLNFLHMLENRKGLLAHIGTGTGVPPNF